jgi:hypothetical protein
MCFAHRIVVNSLYTREIYLKNFKLLGKLRSLPEVIYPSIDLHTYDRKEEIKKEDLLSIKGMEKLKEKNIDVNKMKLIVSLNRYEEKKNLDLAVLSYIDYISKYVNKDDINNTCLVVAGGYDTFLQENINVFNKLNSYIDTPEKKAMNIFFLKNIDNNERSILFHTANIVLYTPKFEHFGIVPLEAMYCGAWVLASKSGGPMESVLDGKTGNLLDNEEPEKWALKIKEMIENEKNFENKNDIIDQEKEITYIEIPESEPKLLSKKRYFNVESKKKAGRKPKYSTSNGEHTKYSYDNILRKIKVKFFHKLIKYINGKIISKYNGIVKKLIPLKGEISQDNTIKFNIQLMKSKLKDIFSNNEINGKFRACDKDYNKNVIDSIYENKIQELIDLLELTFLEVFNIFRDSNETKINGFDNLNTVIDELKLKEGDNDYINKFKEVAMDFENYYLQKKPRK